MPHHRVDAPGQPDVRITAGSGSVTVVAEARADVVADGRVEVHHRDDGTVEVTPQRGSRSMTVRCPEGTSLVVGTRSGSLRLTGRLDAVHATTMSGSIEVEDAASVDLRAMSGKITVGRTDGACRARTKSGSIRIGAAGSVEVHIGSGSVSVDRVEGSVRVRGVSGSVDVNANARGAIEVETMSGSITITLPTGCRPHVRAKSHSGRTRLECESGTDCEVAARTLSGGITVRCR